MIGTVGRYEILDKIGQGGMGTVYKAFDPLLRRTVAIKLISAVLEDASEKRERFFREARAAGQLSHRNIIVIYDLGEEANQPFLAMEYLTGAGLESRMSGGGRLPAARAVRVMSEVLQGLEYAHSNGVVHRDIKPGNLFVTDADEVKILDFGLAHLVSSELTRTETIMGTANYMAPEQIRGERIDRRADVFAAGVVLYELIAGRKAFEGDSFANTLFKVLETTPEPLYAIDSTLPPALIRVVERALAKRKEDRYQTAAEMLRELRACRLPAAFEPPSQSPTTEIPTEVLIPSDSANPALAASGRPAVAARAGTGSVVWSPRRIRTTSMLGGVIVIATLALWLGPRERRTAGAPAAPSRVEVPQEPVKTAPQPEAATPAPQPTAPPPPPANKTTASAPPPAVASAVSAADRSRADAAIARMRPARTLADSAAAATLAVARYRDAVSTEGEARGLYAAGQFAGATSRALEAAALYRSAEIEARAEQDARERQKQAQATPTVPAPVKEPIKEPVKEPPPPEPAAPAPRSEAPVQAPPAAPAAQESPDAIRAVVNEYVAALEARSMTALKHVWPSLGGAQERAIRNEFEHARSLQVQLTAPETEVNGDTARVTATRAYQIMTLDGHRLFSTSRMTMRLRRSNGTWLIESVTYQ